MNLAITGPRRKIKGRVDWPTTHGWKTADEMSWIVRIPAPTIRYRADKYGDTDRRVLDPEPLPHVPVEPPRAKPAKWDRGRCRRDHQNCIHYGECQAKRLGLAEPWIAPTDTDKCYVEPVSHLVPYVSALAVVRGFVG